jgi:hypothetical protein
MDANTVAILLFVLLVLREIRMLAESLRNHRNNG